MSPVVDVRPCEPRDLPLLDVALPLPGPYGHGYRLRGQDQGRWLYLIGLDPSPVGSCLVHWAGPVDETVRQQLPEAAEISSLHVADSARGQGLGRALITEAEREATRRGRRSIGVAVDDGNPDARRLYERLGYEPSGTRFRVEYDYVDESGTATHAIEEGDFLVKILRDT